MNTSRFLVGGNCLIASIKKDLERFYQVWIDEYTRKMTPNIVSPAKESFPEQAKDTKKKTSKLPSSESMVAIW